MNKMEIKLLLAVGVGLGLFLLAGFGIILILNNKETLDLLGIQIGEFGLSHPKATSSVIIGIVIAIIYKHYGNTH